MDNQPSCANCKFLSKPKALDFGLGPKEIEERVICLLGNWLHGSALAGTMYAKAKTYKLRAAECSDYRSELEQEVKST